MTHTFEIGKTYTTRMICDADLILTMEVVKRTEKTVTCLYQGKVRSYRVHLYNGVESFYPDGRYSMASVFTAK